MKKRFKIEVNLYFERNCNGNYNTVNDLTTLAQAPVPNENWFVSNAFISSFQLVDRDLEG